MPTKQESIVLLAAQTAREIARGGEAYMAFLTTAANNFKYDFRDQLLIYAQKPEATACAEISFWNRHGRWVNKGTTGIALLKDTNAPYKLRYVFDMSDTNSRARRTVPVWRIQPQDESAVIETLANRYGTPQGGADLTASLLETAKAVTEDNAADYLTALCEVKNGSLLEELDTDNTEVWFKGILENSIGYMLLTRCGMDARAQFSAGDFAHIADFNTPETISILGTAASDISEMVLREIASTVLSLRRQETRKRDSVAKQEKTPYAESRKQTPERSDEDGTDLSQRGRLSSARPERTRNTEAGQVRDAAAQLSAGASERDLHGDAAVRQAGQPFAPDRPASPRDGGQPDAADGGAAGRDTGAESGRPDEMDGPDEQHPGGGRGSRADGPYLQLTDALPGEEEPPSLIDWTATGSTGLEFSHHDFNAPSDISYYHEDSEKNELLRTCDALKDYRPQIAAFFAGHSDRKERGDFLKGFFDNTYVEAILSNGQRAGYRAWDDVLTLWRGAYLSREKEVFMRWTGVADTIYGMILLRQWLDPDEHSLPSEAEQISFIEQAEAESASAFTLPQEAIDYILCRGSGISQGKYRIYEQFQKDEGKQENIGFLRDEYGIGGHSDAIPGSGYWEEHDNKGITISRNLKDANGKYLLTWAKAEKRIGELIAAGRYLSRAEKEHYPVYQAQAEARKARWDIVKEIRSIIDDYVDFKTQLGENEQCSEVLFARRCADSFGVGEKKCYILTREGSFVLPTLRDAMQTIIKDNTHLTERCEAMLATLSGPLAAPLEPTHEELNPPPPPKKEYRFSLGDTVYLGAQEYSLIAFNEKTVRLYDPTFPLINKEMERAEFDRMLAENPLNDHLAQIVEEAPEPAGSEAPEEPAPPQDGAALAEARTEPFGYDLGFGHLGNGVTVWNRLELQDGDYKTVAHIAPDRTVTFYENGLPEDVRAQIEEFAATSAMTISATQDAPVFSAPPLEREPVRDGSWDDYKPIKEHNPDSLVLYQVGDFFELYGEDSRQVSPLLELETAVRTIPGIGRVAMCGFPAQALQGYTDRLNSRGFDVAAAAVEEGRRKTSFSPAPAMEKAKRLINEFCESEYQGPAHFENLKEIGVGCTTVTDDELPFQAYVNLIDYRLDRYVNDVLIDRRQYGSLQELIRYELSLLNFDDLISLSDKQISKAVQQEQKTPSPPESSRVDEMLRQAELAGRLYEQTGQAVFGFEEGKSQPVNPPQPSGPAIQPGTEFSLDGRRFIVDSVDEAADTVSLRDTTFQNSTGFPIFRSEHIETVQRALAETEKEPEPIKLRSVVIDLTQRADREPEKSVNKEPPAPPMPRPRGNLPPILLHPEIPSAERQDYRITDEHLGEGGEKTKFKNNLTAIQTLQQIEAENRLATPQEQEILARYVGWGGLPQAFDEKNAAWSNEYAQLRATLTEEEYNAARASTLNAHYTSPVVIKAIYKAVENLGFRTGNILEPSCGIGNFFGLVPQSMAASKLYGVELDPITGRIARQLYQNASIAVQGFEKTELPDSFFDLAIGNVPFGNYVLPDKRYDKNHFLIHDYFFARTLDKVRPGGIIAFVTSKGTMDKANSNVRRYIAQRADLLGAVRLPNNAFMANAGTQVTTDILFLQKRDRLTAIDPEWVHLGKTEAGIPINQYFLDHPEMVLGEMVQEPSLYGNRNETTCKPFEGKDLKVLLDAAIEDIHGQIREYTLDEPEVEDEDRSIPADPSVRNFSYAIVDGKLYYRENSRMNPVELSVTAANRVKGLISIRNCVRTLIEYQTDDWSGEAIRAKQRELNALYDSFVRQYGRITSRANKSAFVDDNAYYLLSSLEVLDGEGNFVRKADMFSKRTIRQRVEITHVDTASEALAVSLAEKASVDLGYMASLMGGSEAIPRIVQDLNGVIFKDPASGPFDLEGGGEHWAQGWHTADEYLSGNVRRKLTEAKQTAKEDAFFQSNVQALEQVQPPDLTVGEISVRLGATWIPPEDVEQFIYELFGTPKYTRWKIRVHYSKHTGAWNVEGKSADKGNIRAYNTYGTSRINGYKIVEETLNLRDVRIFDYDEHHNPVLNKKETAIAQGKQALIKQAFLDWIWKDPERRERLCRLYNDRFNCVRPREYDGSHISFVGMNPEITLRKHQINAIAHILYGGNALLGHWVGAGKTYEMAAAAQESKRLGLCQKSLFVVPNHLTEQWAAEYLQLYPAANILVATKKDFETKNRKRFCGRIATGDYDAVIIGHSQFEKIPMSIERQVAILEQQKEELVNGIAELKHNRGERFSIKQMEKSKKGIEAKLQKLNDQSRKDDVVTFEELGVDRIYIDEAHYYKNLAAFSKMRNVGGISQTEAQKSSDLYMKCRYLDELTGGRGIIFATGTPLSNTMVEMYTMQKYLQYDTLKERGLLHFDSWASTFGETVTAIELAPEGTGYRAKTRFARFYNLPELMAMFKEVADIQTADMLKLPVPEAHYHNVVLKPSEQQKEMVAALGERAERVRSRMVDPSEDNMLNITNDGRKLALDQRLLNPLLPDSDTSKVNACAENVFRIWEETKDRKSAQMVFCDLSTPKSNGEFNVYDDLRNKLIAKGIPADEIAFIHSAGSEAQKKEMFGKVRSGDIRVLLGSTQKMGAGTNCQQRLIALHHLDIGWRPADLQQREGRIIRQGNSNPEVDIYTYVTEGTFDAYMFQMVEAKQKFIGQIMTSKSSARSAEDVDETALSYAEIKALCTGNPHIKEKMDLDIEVQRLKLLKANHLSQKYALEDKIFKELPQKIASYEQRIAGYTADMARLAEHTHPDADGFSPMEVEGTAYTDKKAAGSAILAACKAMTSPEPVPLGRYRGFDMELSFDSFGKVYRITLKGVLSHSTDLGTDIFGNILRLDNLLGGMGERLTACRQELENTKGQLTNAKEEVEKPFPQEDELKTKSARLDELNILLNMDKRENEILDGERDEEDAPPPPHRAAEDLER